jgi:hypothetical protein
VIRLPRGALAGKLVRQPLDDGLQLGCRVVRPLPLGDEIAAKPREIADKPLVVGLQRSNVVA